MISQVLTLFRVLTLFKEPSTIDDVLRAGNVLVLPIQ